MKLQVAVEYILIIGLSLAILIPYIAYLTQVAQSYKEENALLTAKNSLEKLGQSIDWVYYQGEPAKIEIEILIPENVESMEIINNTIIWKVRTSAGVSDIYYTSVANISGNLPTKSGYYKMVIEAKAYGVEIYV